MIEVTGLIGLIQFKCASPHHIFVLDGERKISPGLIPLPLLDPWPEIKILVTSLSFAISLVSSVVKM